MSPTISARGDRLIRTCQARAGVPPIGPVTLYTRCGPWAEEFRLGAMWGVRIPEPMFGFLGPTDSERVLSAGPERLFVPDARRRSGLPRSRVKPPPFARREHRYLYGDFHDRESVEACARFRFRAGGRDQAAVFINFREPVECDRRVKRELADLAEGLADLVPDLDAEAAEGNGLLATELIRLLEPTQRLTGFGIGEGNGDLRAYFECVLGACFAAFGLNERTAVGTIHLFQADEPQLELKAARGRFDYDVPSQSPGQGVIWWVADMRRPLLIGDLTRSPFRDLHCCIRKGVRSELVVPMLAGPNLLGVLNLKATIPRAFSCRSVRTICYAANQAAVACHLADRIRETKVLADRGGRLLEVCRAVATPRPPRRPEPLDDLARLACEWPGATSGRTTRPTIGSSAPARTTRGSAARPIPPRPAGDGWTRYILNTKAIVWLHDIEGEDRFQARFWDDVACTWSAAPPAADPPATVNRTLTRRDIRCELGIPLLIRDRCVGVVWLKYDRPDRAAPTPADIATALNFAEHAAVVVDFLDRYEGSGRTTQERMARAITEFRERLFPPCAPDLPGLEVCARSEPCAGEMGGDFHAVVSLDPGGGRIGVLIGDGEDHGIPAALRMLPLYTTFRVFCRQTSSTDYILERLLLLADELQINGTVMYFVIDRASRPCRLVVSTAGHPPLIILRGSGEVLHPPSVNSPVRNLPLGCTRQLTRVGVGRPRTG